MYQVPWGSETCTLTYPYNILRLTETAHRTYRTPPLTLNPTFLSFSLGGGDPARSEGDEYEGVLRRAGAAIAERGVRRIAAYLGAEETRKRVWIMFEKGGKTLNSLIFHMKGEFFKSERVYRIQQLPLYQVCMHLPWCAQRCAYGCMGVLTMVV